MRTRDRHAPTAPTQAVDLALEALAENDPERSLRHAIPALGDVGAGAPGLDLVGRSAVSLGAMSLARGAFEAAAVALTEQGQVCHAVASAVAALRLAGRDAPLEAVAEAFAADVERTSSARVGPPPLHSDDVSPLEDTVPRDELLALARDAVARAPVTDELPARAAHPLWGTLPKTCFMAFAQALQVRLCRAQEQVLTEGQPGDSLYLIARGEVRVVRGLGEKTRDLAVLGAGAVFGEMALLTRSPRAASAITTRAALLLEFPREAVHEALQRSPALGRALETWCRGRLLSNLLYTSAVLQRVPEGSREALGAAFETVTFPAGAALLTQGSAGTGLHLLAQGHVEVRRREDSGGTLQLATLGPGDCVGELSLVLRRPAMATVTAREEVVALVLRPERFLETMKAFPALLTSLYELSVEREEELSSVVAQEALSADDLVLV